MYMYVWGGGANIWRWTTIVVCSCLGSCMVNSGSQRTVSCQNSHAPSARVALSSGSPRADCALRVCSNAATLS